MPDTFNLLRQTHSQSTPKPRQPSTPKPRQSFTLKPLSAKPRQKHTNIARRKHPTVNYQTSPMSHATNYSQTISNGSNPKPRPLSNHAKTTSIFHAKTTLKPRQNHVNLARQKNPRIIPKAYHSRTPQPLSNHSQTALIHHATTNLKPRQNHVKIHAKTTLKVH